MQGADRPITDGIFNESVAKNANITRIMQSLGFNDLPSFHQWTIEQYTDFWSLMCKELKIKFTKLPSQIVDLSQGIASPAWFSDGRINIVESCFNTAKEAIAITYQTKTGQLQYISYGELEELVNNIANSLIKFDFKVGDAIGIALPMNYLAVAIYLAIIKIGACVVSIADSFSTEEMATRLTIAHAKAIFTQDVIRRGDKTINLYEKVSLTGIEKIIVLNDDSNVSVPLRPGDISWQRFFNENSHFEAVACDPMATCNILFSSGTTGEPKAIPWNHTTPIKAASDACLHQNIKPGDVLAWPTNLGWMMGPWLVFAALINKASLALYTGLPKDRTFGEFIANAKVTMLGVVPTLVASWRQSKCMEGLDWSAINVFSSTGECSNPNDMQYLMSLANNKPVIEYCGGTEIGGAYISSTVIQPNYPSTFSTPAMGNRIIILDEEGKPCDNGEVALIPPCIGLSTKLLNKDHYKAYYADMPTYNGHPLRRHGDQLQRLDNGYYSIQGRVDDTMNLGGIKVSSAEIERTLVGIPNLIETAAIAISPPNNGPSLLVIFISTLQKLNKQAILPLLQQQINQKLNPLFKIYDIVFVKELPKTASNKIMRRVLRDNYYAIHKRA